MSEPTTHVDIRGWLTEAKRLGATHLIVATDTFDWGDYPVYVMPDQNVGELVESKYSGQNMQTHTEIYNISKPWEPQLARKFNVEL